MWKLEKKIEAIIKIVGIIDKEAKLEGQNSNIEAMHPY